jgi:hypothetical protein
MKTSLYLTLMLVLCMVSSVQATHIQSGYISYTTDPQNPRKFDFTMIMFNRGASPADDPFVFLNMGDGDGNSIRVDRASKIAYSKHYMKSTYNWSYTYAAFGNYTVTWTGENRNNGIINMPAPSDLLTFQIYTNVRVGAGTQNLHGAKLAGAPISIAYAGEPWTHNLLAYDADGDQLLYQLVTPKYRSPTQASANVPGYFTPPGLTVSEFGELYWENPTDKGEYVIAVRVTELRDGREIGSMVVDLYFLVSERTSQPKLSLLNKDRLTLNNDGSLQTWPGEPVKLEFYIRKSPNSDLPLIARKFGEIDTLQLVDATLVSRDTLSGLAVTYTFTPSASMERSEPYLVGVRGNPVENVPDYQGQLNVEHDWAFAYVYVGEQRRPLSSGDDLTPGILKPYPNPVGERFTLEAPNLPALHLHVRDVTGKVVGSYALKPGTNSLTRPQNLAAGVYFYTLTSRLVPVGSGKLVLQ